ncbi:MAG: hypothetical protein U0Z26_10270 [Anaerolineales bacterium]
MRKTTIIVFFVIFILGCKAMTGVLPQPASTATPEPQKTSLPFLAGDWQITLHHSGGIMGLSRSIEVSSDGTYTVTDEISKQTKQGQLSKEELDNLLKIATSSQFSPNTEQYGCADCFIYNIEILSDTKFSAQVDDVTVEASGLEPLITNLREIMERELKQ